VQRGGVRLFTRTTERPVEQDIRLREEHARVERHPADRPATEAELGEAFKEKSVELRETAEEPVVAKTARVVEEVQIGEFDPIAAGSIRQMLNDRYPNGAVARHGYSQTAITPFRTLVCPLPKYKSAPTSRPLNDHVKPRRRERTRERCRYNRRSRRASWAVPPAR